MPKNDELLDDPFFSDNDSPTLDARNVCALLDLGTHAARDLVPDDASDPWWDLGGEG